MSDKKCTGRYIKNIAAVSMCTAFIVISSWLTIPFTINFTLQTFAIFVICLLFDFKVALSSIIVYMLIGAVGIPVFSGFGAGLSSLLGPTGGFLLSFILFPFIMSIFKNRSNMFLKIASMMICIAVCYTFGTFWYYLVYGGTNGANIFGILSICVFPFIIPDLIKILLAALIYNRLSKINLMK